MASTKVEPPGQLHHLTSPESDIERHVQYNARFRRGSSVGNILVTASVTADVAEIRKRKRTSSASCGGCVRHPPSKRRKKTEKVRPTRFLLGGTDSDPLNLTGMDSETKARQREHPVDVIIPTDIYDPLNLTSSTENDAVDFVAVKSRRRKQKKAKKKVVPEIPVPTEPASVEDASSKRTRRVSERIVSPVIKQPGARNCIVSYNRSVSNESAKKMYREKDVDFQYGNYNRYYGYRNPNQGDDERLRYLKKEWFRGKSILDIGCNIGHVTISVARDYEPSNIIGIDIDKKLIQIAQKNVRHYLNRQAGNSSFPSSMPVCFGPAETHAVVPMDEWLTFPNNVKFVYGNYVLECDELLETVTPEFDVILCLSVTKWIHLNWGDEGLKRTFKKMYAQLKPGGRLILEIQGFPSYKKKKNLTPAIRHNFDNIKFFPTHFSTYLLKEVGFAKHEAVATPQHQSKGFQRPIDIFLKREATSHLPASATTVVPKSEKVSPDREISSNISMSNAEAVEGHCSLKSPVVVLENPSDTLNSSTMCEGSYSNT